MPKSTKQYRVARWQDKHGNMTAALVRRPGSTIVGTLKLEGKFQGAFGKRTLNALLAREGRDNG